MFTFRQISRKIQNYATSNSQLENKVRELTTTDLWGPTTQQMFELKEEILSSTGFDGLVRITSQPSILDLLPPPDRVSDSSKIIFHLFYRIFEYSEVPIVGIPFQKLRAYFNEERPAKALVLEKYGSHQLYENIKKNYINQGSEYWIIQKSLSVLEYLLLNCYGEEYDVRDEILSYRIYLVALKDNYVCSKAVDSKMKAHTELVRSKCSAILLLLEDRELLSDKRSKLKVVNDKFQHHTNGLYLTTRNRRSSTLGSLAKARHLRGSSGNIRLLEGDLYSDDIVALRKEPVQYNDQDLSHYYDSNEDDSDGPGTTAYSRSGFYDSMPDDDYLTSSNIGTPQPLQPVPQKSVENLLEL